MKNASIYIVVSCLSFGSACAGGGPYDMYRLRDSGNVWTRSGGDIVLEDLRSIYPEYFLNMAM